jgi:hypothetical protein
VKESAMLWDPCSSRVVSLLDGGAVVLTNEANGKKAAKPAAR